MTRAIAILLGLLSGIAVAADAPGVAGDAVFSDLLATYVRGDRVNYAALCADDRLDHYTDYLSGVDPATLTDDAARLAFWINAYNAFTLKIICDNYPVESINDLHFGGLIIGQVLKKTVWHRKFIEIAGEKYSLNNIEHDIIREEFDDPRIHFALVCAAKSCPPLRAEAYAGSRLDEQLDDQARAFLAHPDKNRFDVNDKRADISKILDWYGGDFGEDTDDVLLYLTRYLPAEIAAAIRENPGEWKVEYTKYDWSLNE